MTHEADTQPVIVVGHDGSDRGADALAFAAMYARAVGGRLVVAGWYREEYPVFPGSPALEEDLRRLTLEPLERIQTSLLGVPVELRAVRGRSPADALHRLSEEAGAELVVVGSTRRGRIGRVLPGSTGERLLQESPCAVAIVPLGFAPEPKHDLELVAAAFEPTVEGRRAVDVAAAIAQATGAGLLVLTVVEPVAGIYGVGLDTSVFESIQEDAEERARQNIDEQIAALPADVRVETSILHGSATPKLLEALHGGVDLLVMGSRAYGPIGRALVGTVSGSVVRQATCPVVIVPRAAAMNALDDEKMQRAGAPS
jgi:nucleotide-binding universal stress UspA family protein